MPFLIRVASIGEVRGHQVLVAFDGWPAELAVWLDDDSPDLHPVGWCLKTQHPLEPPLSKWPDEVRGAGGARASECESNGAVAASEELGVRGPCGVGGCRGLGSLRGGPLKQHSAASACPYRPRAAPAPPDRLSERAPSPDRVLPRSRRVPAKPKSVHTSTPTSDAPKEK